MELNKVEMTAVENVGAEDSFAIEQVLSQLQLAMVGGGIGETIL